MNSEQHLVPEAAQMRDAIRVLAADARRYRELEARYCGADFTQPSPTGQGTRCVLIFAWPDDKPVSKSLDVTVDALHLF